MENKDLFLAMASFQYEVPIIHRGTAGYGYSYTDLPEIVRVITPLLKKHNLGYTQLLQGTSIQTIIFHTKTGQSIESFTDIPQEETLKGMNKFQVLGSAITYFRRYSLSCALGLVTDKDLDGCGTPESPEEKEQKRLEQEQQKQRDLERLKADFLVKIKESKTEEELKTVWNSIPKELRKEFETEVKTQRESLNK